MSLETIVQNMVAAKEPEVNIAKVIKHYNQINKSPLKQTEEIVESETVEMPDCESQGMIWSEEEQKCIPKPVDVPEIELTPTPSYTAPSTDIETPQNIETGTAQSTVEEVEEDKKPEEKKDVWSEEDLIAEDQIYNKYGVGRVMPDGSFYASGTGPVWEERVQLAAKEIEELNSKRLEKDLLQNSEGLAQNILTNIGISQKDSESDVMRGIAQGSLRLAKSIDGMAFQRALFALDNFNKKVKEGNLSDTDEIEYGGWTENPPSVIEWTDFSGKKHTKPSGQLETYISKFTNPSKTGTVAEARKYYNDKFIKPFVSSKKYQDLLGLMGSVQILDGEGNFTDEAQQVVGEQLMQMPAAMMSLGGSTLYQESTNAALEIIDTKLREGEGILYDGKYENLSEPQKAELALEIYNNGEVDLDAVMENASKAAGMDLVSNFFVVGKATKVMPKKFFRDLFSKNFGKTLKKELPSTIGTMGGELLTELGQEGLGQAAVLRGLGKDRDANVLTGLIEIGKNNPMDILELGVQTLIGTGGVMTTGQALSTSIKGAQDLAKDLATKGNPNATRAIVNKAKKGVQEAWGEGKITRLERNNRMDILEATEKFVDNSKVKNLSGKAKEKAFDQAVKREGARNKIEELSVQIKEATDAGDATIDLEIALDKQNKIFDKAENNIIKEVGLDVINKQGTELANWINSQKEGDFADKKIKIVSTVNQAKKYIQKTFGADKLKDSEVKLLLKGGKGANNAIKIGNEGIIVKNNIKDNLDSGDLMGVNSIHHEALHFILDNATASELNTLKKDILKDFDKIKDPKFQEAIAFANTRIKDYKKAYKGKNRNKALFEEWFTSLSDGLREQSVKDLSLEDGKALQSIGNKFKKVLGLVSDESLNFNNMNAANTLQFIKKFNNFNSKKGPISIKKPKITGVNIEEVRASKPLSQQNINDQFKDLKKGEINDNLAIQAAYAYEPLAQSTAAKIYKNYPEYSEQGYTLDDFANELTYGDGANSLMGLAKGYDPEIGSIGGWFKKYLPERAKAVIEGRIGKQVTTGATRTDAKEARQVQDTKQPSVELKKSINERLGIKSFDKIADKTLDLGLIKAIKQIDKKGPKATLKQKTSERKKGLGDIIKREYGPLIKKEVLKKDFIDKKWKSLGDIYLENTDVSKIRNPETKELLESWINDGFTKEDIVNYFDDPNVPANTRSDRKNVGLVNAIITGLSNEARIEKAKRDPKTAQAFKEKAGIPLASKPLSNKTKKWLKDNFDITPQTLESNIAQVLKKYGQNKKFDFQTIKGREEAFEAMEKAFINIPNGMVTLASLKPNGRIIFKNLYDKGGKWISLKTGKPTHTETSKLNPDKKAIKEYQNALDDFNKRRDKLISNLKEKGKVKLYGAAEGWVAKAYDKAFGTTASEVIKNKDKIIEQNTKNTAMHRQTWAQLYNNILEDKSTAPIIAWFLQNSGGTANNWHRLGAEVVAGSKTGEIRWEHAMQAKNAYTALIDSALAGVPFDIAYNAVSNNYKVIALNKTDDAKLNKAGFRDKMPEGWNFYTDSWLQRYFNPYVAVFDGGINPSSIETLNGENYSDLYNIKPNGLAKDKTIAKASKPLSKEFNKILERSKGIKAEAEYSEARAIKLGQKKGFQAFVPYSAEDYLGLIYPTLGKGKQGDKDLQWYKDNIMDPYNNGIQEFEVAKQGSMAAWNELKKQIKNTPANLKKEAVRGFNNEDAVRIYLWDKEGVTPGNLAKKDVREINKYINKNPELIAFANQVQTLNPDGYPAPNNNWLAGTITTDLVNHVNTVSRSEFLKPWQEAVDAIYTDANKNKLRATFGNNYIEALEDTLYRMKTGRNRPAGTNRITNTWLNWLNDSVGTVMFLNQRSALLQTISSINYLNWTDNNPAQAAKAFANQKQFWNDFTYLFNSDFLKQRRSGLKTDVNADEIAQSAATSPNKARAAASWLLKKGFLPTQMADSFAISIGGASFYRNRVNKYKKEGLNQKEAEEKAFLDFRNTTTEAQQSADPSRISMQQASPLGRVILAFANTPIQYTRLTKRAIQDLANKRGDWKTNVSKIIYYGAVQNIIFTALQQALFGIAFDDDDEEIGDKEAQFRKDRKEGSLLKLLNSSADTILRGSGVGGAFVAMLKNLALEAKRQSEKSRSDYERVADKLFSFSPVIDSKFRKLQSAGRTFTYKQELKKIQERGVAIDNPALMAAAQTLSAFANVPLDRAIKKINNLQTMTEEETKLWQQIALFMGYGEWELGIQARKVDEERAKAKQEKAEEKKFKNLQKNIDKGTKKKSPVKALQHGVLGRANKDGTIEVAPGLSPKKRAEVIRHEKLHQKEMKSGKLDYDDSFVYYGKKKFARKNGMIAHAGKWKKEGDHSLPWEKFAHKHDNNTKIA